MADFSRYDVTMSNEPTLAEKAKIAKRRYELSRLLSQGVRRHADLAERLGVSTSTVKRDLAELEQIYSEQGAEQIVALQNRERMISFERIEDGILKLQPMIENPRTRIQALRLLKELEERRAKLLGLDMPTKHAATDPTGTERYSGIPEELKRRALERYRQQRQEEAASRNGFDAAPELVS